jgi:hypothetical protein
MRMSAIPTSRVISGSTKECDVTFTSSVISYCRLSDDGFFLKMHCFSQKSVRERQAVYAYYVG